MINIKAGRDNENRYAKKINIFRNKPKIASENYIGIMKIKKIKFILAMKKIKDKSKNQYFTEALNYLIITNSIVKLSKC